VDGRTVLGKPLGVLGETLRVQSVYPARGPLLLAFTEVEPLSLHAALGRCIDAGDGEAILRLADLCSRRGLVDLALHELDRAAAAEPSPAMERAVRERRRCLHEDAARRGLADARDHMEARRSAHARAALEDLLVRFPGTAAAEEARALRRSLAG
jgi:hypothetical protein